LSSYNVPLIVGEFGADHQGEEVDEDSILAVAETYNIGYLGWSWSGNSGGTESLDITYNFDVNNLSPWGDRLINGVNGLRATSQIASVFAGQPGNQTPVAFDQSVQVEQDGSASITLQGSDADGQVVDYTITTEPASGNLSGSGVNRVYTPDSGFSGSDLFRFTVTDNEGATSSAATVNIKVTAQGGGDNCVYTAADEWNHGFTATITISNNGSSAIDGWQVSWQYSGGDVVTGVWNAELSGDNPYTATNLTWNATIKPGETVTFGFEGTKGGDTAEVPAVTGDVCN
jgi:mannan endo-1,4-beta-mannosidase